MATEVRSQDNMCEQYRAGDITRNRIAVFHRPEDMAKLKKTSKVGPELRAFFYREEYVKQPHLRGFFGEYPPPDYELSIGFQINIDTGQPVPQSNQDYTRTYKENRDFMVAISSTWVSLAEQVHPKVALPLDRSVTVEDYEVIGQRYGMQEVSYLSALISKGGDDYALRTNKNLEVFLDAGKDGLRSFMICNKVTEFVKVPHCEYFQIIDGFFTETRFKKSLIGDLEEIKRRSSEFVTCLFRGE